MRVIAGRFKGCRLVAPLGEVARPTTDRVKESMFNLMGFQWRGGVAVDLFAGSGALGLEAVSRGATRAVFVDTHPRCVAAVQENMDRCARTLASEAGGPVHVGEVWRLDWEQALQRLVQADVDVGWIFLDPPYAQNLWPAVLEVLDQSPLRILHGVVCEHPKTVTLSSRVGRLQADKSKVYGDIAVTFYKVVG